MPAPSNPPYSAGAVIQPRMLNRWLDINVVRALTRAKTYFTIPTFSVVNNWKGYSELVAVFNYVSPNNFSIKTLGNTFPVNPNYLACVVWEDSSYNVHRYKLWEDVGEVLYFDTPLYNNQQIKKNFRIEIWTTNTLFDIEITGAGSTQFNGIFHNTATNIWILNNNYTIERQPTVWWMYSPSALYYTSTTIDSFFPLGPWIKEPAGANPVPVTTPINLVASQTAALNIYTSVLQAYDYRYRSDTTLATTPTIVTALSNVLPLVLPATFPVNSSPTLN
jgi:hypothetical protein